MALRIELLPLLSDNYAYLLVEPDSGSVGVVDPSEADPVLAELEKNGLTLTHIVNTHHHWDHTGGNEKLKEQTGAQVVGPRADRDRIPGIDVELGEGDVWRFGGEAAHIFDTPGHTRGAICFWFPDSEALFSGDTLFSLGCGRLFEGTPEQMWTSLLKLRGLPDETRLYCGHEYTQANARFCATVEPDNPALADRQRRVDTLRGRGQPTIPAVMGEEKRANPFLRADIPSVAKSLGMPEADPVSVFAAIRSRKDSF